MHVSYEINIVHVALALLAYVAAGIGLYLRIDRRIYTLELRNQKRHKENLGWVGGVLKALVNIEQEPASSSRRRDALTRALRELERQENNDEDRESSSY